MISIVSLGGLQSVPAGLRHVLYFLKMVYALRGARFVLALDTYSVGVPTLYAARLLRIPLVVRIGGDFLWEHFVERTKETVRLSEFYDQPRNFSLFERAIKREARAIVARATVTFFNTQFQKKIWQKPYSLAENRTRILENYYPPQQAFILPSNHTFVHANRPTFYKNASKLESAFARVQARHPEIALDRAHVPHDQQLTRLSIAYAAIIPSISEVGSNTAIEAVSVGRPFIITEDTGTSERLRECGLFVDSRSEDALKGALESLLDPRVYTQISEKIRAFSFTHSWDEIADEILAVV